MGCQHGYREQSGIGGSGFADGDGCHRIEALVVVNLTDQEAILLTKCSPTSLVIETGAHPDLKQKLVMICYTEWKLP